MPPGVLPKGARGRILTAALRLFADLGYGGTSVRDICASAEVQATTLYVHFPSKEDVLAEIIRLGHEELLRRLREALLAAQPDPREQLVALVRAHVLSHCEHAMLAVVASAELHALSEATAAPIRVVSAQAERLALDVVERGITLQLFNCPEPALALRAISSMGQRAAYWFAPGCGKTPQQVADTFADFALRIVGAQNKN
ncbi:transcriptional regulator, TetR family [Solimonas aquatica]|uniref:Transcriptional regulator, TetR family n=1 Tax=Solimonas aquatica TaxID=489703 RepID=A0A1H9CF74_9GAMM|nr:TetR/AcrR family transcriptional regulator [Solimonas aquatica]SEP99846.1 transcriptional regulator, TetR family [Solimonas aquatica]